MAGQGATNVSVAE